MVSKPLWMQLRHVLRESDQQSFQSMMVGLSHFYSMNMIATSAGDASGAEAIRRELASISNVGDLADYPESDGMLTGATTLDPEAKSKRTIETLERWLLNLQRGAS